MNQIGMAALLIVAAGFSGTLAMLLAGEAETNPTGAQELVVSGKTQGAVNAYDVIQAWCKNAKPDCLFTGATKQDYERWRAAFAEHYQHCLGPWPAKTTVRVETLERVEKDGYIREKIRFDSSPDVTVPAYLLIPKDIKPGEKRPGILAAHGHGHGKDDICGVTRELGADQDGMVANLNYEYALEAVRRGYVVIAPDWMPFGERLAPISWTRTGRDPCNVVDLAFQYFGRCVLTQNIWDGMRAVDVLASRPEVDPQRLAVIGLSYGGTMASHLLINDPRLKTGVVSGYLSTVRDDALSQRGNGNFCGSQHVPELLLHGDIPEMLGLACPKPVLIEMGEKENCFYFPDMLNAFERLRKIYRAAGVEDRLEADIHPNAHRWSGAKAWQWLEQHLAPR